MRGKRRTTQVPSSAMKLTRYDELEVFAEKFAESLLNLVAVVGTAGLRKSRTFVNAMEKTKLPYCLLKGHVRPFVMYQLLYQHRDQLIIIDDADSLFSDRSCVPLLKSLLETEACKVVSWHSRAIDDETIPRSFTTRSKVAILCNEWRTVNENMRAVEDRGHFIHFTPSVEEVHSNVGRSGWFDDDEVFNFIGDHLHLVVEPSMRYYVKASEMRRAGIEDWQGKTLQMVNGDMERILVVRRLLRDSAYNSEAERVSAYVNETGRAQATYYRDRDLLLGVSSERSMRAVTVEKLRD